MLYRKYFDDNQTQREFFDFIAGQVTKRTMSADDQGLFVEFEAALEFRKCKDCGDVYPPEGSTAEKYLDFCSHFCESAHEYMNSSEPLSDSGQLTSFALPMAVAAIAMYLMHFMAAHGILQSLTMIGGH